MRARLSGVAAVVGAFALSAGVASAAGLSVGSGGLGAATASVPKCGAVALDSTTPYIVDGAGQVTNVNVTIDRAVSTCSAGTVVVSLRSANGATVVGEGSAPLTSCTAGAATIATCNIAVSGLPGLDVVKMTHVLVTGA